MNFDKSHLDNKQLLCLEQTLSWAESLIKDSNMIVTFDFYNTPEFVRSVLCFNGGDEDYIIFAKSNNDCSFYVERVNHYHDYDKYIFDDYTFYVISH